MPPEVLGNESLTVNQIRSIEAMSHRGQEYNNLLKLQKSGCLEPNAVDSESGESLLIKAASYSLNRVKTILLLLEAGARVNVSNSIGYSPLHILAQDTTLTLAKEAMQAVLEAGADPYARDNAGWTILHVLVRENNSLQRLQDFQELFSEHLGSLVSSRDMDGNTPLHVVGSGSYYQYVRDWLLAIGADPTVRNNAGQTPAEFANLSDASDLHYRNLQRAA